MALAHQFDEPSYLPKQDVAPPQDGYSVTSKEPNKFAAGNTNRTTGKSNSSDQLNDMHIAGLERNSSATGSSNGIPSTQPKAADPMFAQTTNPPGMPSNPPPYGTTTPIEPGFADTNTSQTAQMATAQPLQTGNSAFGAYSSQEQLSMTQQSGYPPYQPDPNAGMFANNSMGQSPVNPGYDQPGQQFVTPGQQFVTPGQALPQDQTFFPGQPNMMVQIVDQPQTSLAGTGDPFSGFPNPATVASPASPQMVASAQGMGYGQGFGSTDPAMNAIPAAGPPTQTAPVQTATSNAVPANGYGQQPVMTPNPVAAGTSGYPMADPALGATQQLPQAIPMQQTTYQGQPYATQSSANNAYQNGFNYFGPTNDDFYRPGGM
ncbi:MAG: hypothetical protein FWH27_02820 [Planctomycetaceae bacterium]|nr:hypothetical protein [Planctomycetaceae bacterium]